MNKNVKFYKCKVCGNIIELVDGDITHVSCCNNDLELLVANTEDASFEYIPESTIYAYCNIHGLWKKEVK